MWRGPRPLRPPRRPPGAAAALPGGAGALAGLHALSPNSSTWERGPGELPAEQRGPGPGLRGERPACGRRGHAGRGAAPGRPRQAVTAALARRADAAQSTGLLRPGGVEDLLGGRRLRGCLARATSSLQRATGTRPRQRRPPAHARPHRGCGGSTRAQWLMEQLFPGVQCSGCSYGRHSSGCCSQIPGPPPFFAPNIITGAVFHGRDVATSVRLTPMRLAIGPLHGCLRLHILVYIRLTRGHFLVLVSGGRTVGQP
mmetsp:Transcript_49554/g.143802  ORF Transcript_49554/g.143802 Transcript_49554/m.143802 type:complete len:256 (-) Transcript_49554:2-769(-)